jgi:hypothetical protein
MSHRLDEHDEHPVFTQGAKVIVDSSIVRLDLKSLRAPDARELIDCVLTEGIEMLEVSDGSADCESSHRGSSRTDSRL